MNCLLEMQEREGHGRIQKSKSYLIINDAPIRLFLPFT